MRRELWSVIAVDPGGFTGVVGAVVPVDDGRLRFDAVTALDKARAAQMTFGVEVTDDKWQEHVNLLIKAVRQARRWVAGKVVELGYDGYKSVLIVEGFGGTDAVLAGDPFSPIKISACLQWILEDVVDEWHSPLPAEKGQITDQRLKLWTLWVPGKRHQNDAMRHMMVYLRHLEISRP